MINADNFSFSLFDGCEDFLKQKTCFMWIDGINTQPTADLKERERIMQSVANKTPQTFRKSCLYFLLEGEMRIEHLDNSIEKHITPYASEWQSYANYWEYDVKLRPYSTPAMHFIILKDNLSEDTIFEKFNVYVKSLRSGKTVEKMKSPAALFVFCKSKSFYVNGEHKNSYGTHGITINNEEEIEVSSEYPFHLVLLTPKQ